MFGPFVGFSAIELVILLAISGNTSLPLGVPPADPDPIMFQMAPEECVFYATWMGAKTPDPNSTNSTEQFFADAEIREFLLKLEGAFDSGMAFARDEMGAEADRLGVNVFPELLKTALLHHAAIAVKKMEFDDGVPAIEASALLRADDRAGPLFEQLKTWIAATMEDDEFRSVEVDGHPFVEVRSLDGMLLSIGQRDDYLVFAVGDGAVKELFASIAAGEPDWLAALRTDLEIARPSTYSYVALDKVIETASNEIDEESFDNTIEAFGFANVTTYRAATGLDDSGFKTIAELIVDGTPSGLLGLVDGQRLSQQDLAGIPGQAPVALTMRLDPTAVYDLIEDVVDAMEPGSGRMFSEAAKEAGDVLGSRIREDIIESLGDRVTIYAAPHDGGLLTGWIAAIEVENHMVLSTANARMIGFLHAMFREDRWAPQIRTMSVSGTDVTYLAFRDNDVPFTPSWCVSGDELLFSIFPQAIKSHLSRVAPAESLAANQAVSRLVSGDNSHTLAVCYIDTAQVAETIYPLVQLYVHMLIPMAQRGQPGIEFNVGDLPSLASVTRHAEPSIAVLQRTENGFRAVTHQTIPRGEPGVSAPILAAMMFPAIDSARFAAKRTMSANNLKQVSLALHNYNEVYRGLPASFSIDDVREQNPLLSWRVHILPFIEHQHLYEQFRLDEPWDSEHNLALVDQMPEIYALPGMDPKEGLTVYQGVYAEDGAFWNPSGPNARGQGGRRFAEFRDGLSNTIWVVETNEENAIPWTKPGDFEAPGMQPAARLSGNWKGGFHVGMADGSVVFVPDDVDPDILRQAFKMSDGGPIGFHEMINPARERVRGRAVPFDAPAPPPPPGGDDRAVPVEIRR